MVIKKAVVLMTAVHHKQREEREGSEHAGELADSTAYSTFLRLPSHTGFHPVNLLRLNFLFRSPDYDEEAYYAQIRSR